MDPANLGLNELFREQAWGTLDALALEGSRISLTYRELGCQADLLVSRLQNAGVGPDEPVGVYMERRTEYIVARLATLKAGGATSRWR